MKWKGVYDIYLKQELSYSERETELSKRTNIKWKKRKIKMSGRIPTKGKKESLWLTRDKTAVSHFPCSGLLWVALGCCLAFVLNPSHHLVGDLRTTHVAMPKMSWRDGWLFFYPFFHSFPPVFFSILVLSFPLFFGVQNIYIYLLCDHGVELKRT